MITKKKRSAAGMFFMFNGNQRWDVIKKMKEKKTCSL